MTTDDLLLMDYMGGRMTSAQRQEFVARAMADPSLAQRALRQQLLAEAARESFQGDLAETVPATWISMIDTALPEREQSSVADFRSYRADRHRIRGAWPVGGLLAASLIIGLFAGNILQAPGLLKEKNGNLLAAAPMAEVLDVVQSGVPTRAAGYAIEVQLSLRTPAGGFCREALMRREEQAQHLLACRQGGDWRVVGLAEAPLPEEEYATASGANPLDAQIEMLNGQALNAAAEQKAIQDQWSS